MADMDEYIHGVPNVATIVPGYEGRMQRRRYADCVARKCGDEAESAAVYIA